MASQGGIPGAGANGYDAASILGDVRYRRILAILLDRFQPVPSRELSVQVAAREADIPPSEVPETECESVRMELEHRYLSKLERVGWVDRTPDGLTATAPRPAPRDVLSLPSLREPEHPHWDPVSTLLARPYRIAVAALLADRQQPLALAQLAEQLREHEQEYSLPARQRLRLQLYHVDLPKLADADLVEFDSAEQTVARTSLTSDIICTD
ncbi:hypothetical protein EGH22_08105 [Halomicroarcula sp. F28]|uniref:DUF7344 domain-containing protein n=1 Tax=Haloarcula salinisoli TaxID=2487746 RepID=UPI001C7386BB|nr:hypothetical protein [Halomicroarcula salinisoli]MBX0286286.1 hypothetical protein [Halomicroarcula salinisoli]